MTSPAKPILLSDVPAHHARRGPNAVALRFAECFTTWAEMDECARRVAAALRAIGRVPGARVANLGKEAGVGSGAVGVAGGAG